MLVSNVFDLPVTQIVYGNLSSIYSEKEQQENDEETIKIIFNFAKNPYLSNDSLEKIIKTKDDVGIKSSHTPIQWKVPSTLKKFTFSTSK